MTEDAAERHKRHSLILILCDLPNPCCSHLARLACQH